jgi:hypothetical protein
LSSQITFLKKKISVPSPNRPSLFRKDFSPTTLATHHGDPIVTQNVTHPNVSNSNARETWRLDTLVRIISIFWLEPFALESSKNYQVLLACSIKIQWPFKNQTIVVWFNVIPICFILGHIIIWNLNVWKALISHKNKNYTHINFSPGRYYNLQRIW